MATDFCGAVLREAGGARQRTQRTQRGYGQLGIAVNEQFVALTGAALSRRRAASVA